MAKIWITKFAVGARLPGGTAMPAGKFPSRGTEVVTFTTVQLSTAMDGNVSMVRIYADTACRIDIGAAPVATASSMPMAAGAAEYFGVENGHKVSVYDGVS